MSPALPVDWARPSQGLPIFLVKNAGTIHRGLAEDHDLDASKEVLQVILTSASAWHSAGREMLQRRPGKIVEP